MMISIWWGGGNLSITIYPSIACRRQVDCVPWLLIPEPRERWGAPFSGTDGCIFLPAAAECWQCPLLLLTLSSIFSYCREEKIAISSITCHPLLSRFLFYVFCVAWPLCAPMDPTQRCQVPLLTSPAGNVSRWRAGNVPVNI